MSEKINLVSLRNVIAFIFIFLLILLFIFANVDNNRLNNKLEFSTLYDHSFDNLDTCKISQNELLKKVDKNYKISYVETPLFPEVENIRCLGKVKNFIVSETETIIYVYTSTLFLNLTFFLGLSLLIFCFLYPIKNNKLLFILFNSSFISLVSYLFLGALDIGKVFNLLLATFIIFFIFSYLVNLYKTSDLRNKENKFQEYFVQLALLLTVYFLVFIEYIFVDYFIYLTIIGWFILFLLSKAFKILFSDKLIIIFLSHLALFFNGVDLPLSRNHYSYLPNILSSTSNLLSLDYQSNISFPYPAFKGLLSLFINIFGLNVLNFLNYLSLFLIMLFVISLIYYLNKEQFVFVSTVYIFLSSSVLHDSIFKKILNIENIDNFRFFYIYTSNGLADHSLITALFQPSTFDILIIPSLILIMRNKAFAGFFLLSISTIMHTSNIIASFIVFLAYVLSKKKIKKEDIFKVSPLLVTTVIFTLYYLNSFDTTPASIIQADRVYSDWKSPGHSKFSYSLSLLRYTPLFVNFDTSNLLNFLGLNLRESFSEGFSFHIELLIFSTALLYKLKNRFIKNIVWLSLVSIVFSILLSILNNHNSFGSLIRNVRPWRLSSLIYMIFSIYLLIYIFKKVNERKYIIFSFLIILVQINFIYFTINPQNTLPIFDKHEKELLRRDIQEIANSDDDLRHKVNVTMRYDSGIIFKNFYPTTGNIYSHPYSPDELIKYKYNHDVIHKFYNSNPECEDAINLLERYESDYMLFSDKKFVPGKIQECDNFYFDENREIFIFKK